MNGAIENVVDEPDVANQHTKLVIQHVARHHSQWLITSEGQAWVEKLNEKVDDGWFRKERSLDLDHKRSVCPVCTRELAETPPLFESSACTATWQPPSHWHSLLVAVWHNDIQHIEILLQDSQVLFQIDNGPHFGDNRSALYHAVRYDQPDIAKLLLKARADPLKRIQWQPRTNRPWITTTPYHAIDPHQNCMIGVFNEVLWSHASVPLLPPAPLVKTQLSNGTFLWI